MPLRRRRESERQSRRNHRETGGGGDCDGNAKQRLRIRELDGKRRDLADAAAKEITFTMPAGDVTLTANFKALQKASLDKTTATYDLTAANRSDIEVTLTPGDYTFKELKRAGNETLAEGTDYTKDGNKFTIKTSYLDQKLPGTNTLAFIMEYDGATESKARALL